LKQLFQL